MSLYSDMKQAATIEDRVWRALGDPIRRRMLDELARAARTTGELVVRFEPLCRTAVMKHLDVLAAAELVVVRRAGRVRWNHFNPVPIDGVCRRWMDAHRRRVSGALNRLKDVVEGPLDGPGERAVDVGASPAAGRTTEDEDS